MATPDSIPQSVNPHCEDISIIIYTSGTTGNPKVQQYQWYSLSLFMSCLMGADDVLRCLSGRQSHAQEPGQQHLWPQEPHVARREQGQCVSLLSALVSRVRPGG
jgi:acyl-CoA synthetase (AMP-forming)/AMP-acid ligase II